MGEMRYVLAMDSGGSKTVCLLARADGTVVAVGRGRGVGNLSLDPAVVAEALRPAVGKALGGLPAGGRVVAAYGCLGGLNVAAVRAALETVVAADCTEVQRESSGEVVFACAPLWGFDIAVMAGTGSIALGINAAGESRVVGGWGALIHDCGSGYAVGRQSLQAIAEALDSRGEGSLLLTAFAEVPPFDHCLPRGPLLGMSPRDLDYGQRLAIKEGIKKAFPELDRGSVAALFPVVCACAEQGDPLAVHLLDQAARDLALLASMLADELAIAAPRVLASGGVFRAGRCMMDPFRSSLSELLPQARVQEDGFALVVGAVIVALVKAGLPVDAALAARVRQSAAGILGA